MFDAIKDITTLVYGEVSADFRTRKPGFIMRDSFTTYIWKRHINGDKFPIVWKNIIAAHFYV